MILKNDFRSALAFDINVALHRVVFLELRCALMLLQVILPPCDLKFHLVPIPPIPPCGREIPFFQPFLEGG